MSSISRPPEPWLVAIILIVQSRGGPRCVFHTPANPDLDQLFGPDTRRGRAANDAGSDEESQSSSDEEEDEDPNGPGAGNNNSGGPGGGGTAGNSSTGGARPSNANVDDSNSTTASSIGGDTHRPPSLNSGKFRRKAELEDSTELVAIGRGSGVSSSGSGGGGSASGTTYGEVFDSVFGLPSDVWEKLLSPSRAWHKRRFEIGINDLAFVGWPVFVRDDGTWRKKSRRRKRNKPTKGKDTQTKPKSDPSDPATEEATQDEDNQNPVSAFQSIASGGQSPKEDENTDKTDTEDDNFDSQAGSPDGDKEDKDAMSMFNVVFVMAPPALEYSIHLREMYEHVIKKFSKALKYEQDHSDYVWKEAQRILQLKEQAREREISRDNLHDELVSKSSLAAAIHSVFDKISKSDIAFISLKSRSADFQIPPMTSIADLPPHNDPSLAGMWLTTANTVTADHGTDLEVPNQVLAKHFALLLLESEASIMEALKGSELAPALAHYIHSSRPNKSFAQISARSGIPLDTIHDLAQHLVYWRRARAIPPLHQRDTYIVSPNCDLSQLKKATLSYAATFPTLPSLPKMLSALSGTPRPYATFIPSKEHKEMYFAVLAWLLRGGWVTQLRTFSRVKVTPEIKYAVEQKMRKEQLDKYIQSGRQAGSPSSDQPFGDGSNSWYHEEISSTRSVASSMDSQRSGQFTPLAAPGYSGLDGDHFESYLERNPHLNMSSLILFPHRASPLESRWLDEIMSRFPDTVLPPVLSKANNDNDNDNDNAQQLEGEDVAAKDSLKVHWPKFVKYFNGTDALEKIAVREGMRRKVVWQLLQRWGLGGGHLAGPELDAREQVLVTVRHW